MYAGINSPYYQPQPLYSWGSFSGQIRHSASSYVESVWQGTALKDGTHLTAADGVVDIVLTTKQGSTRLLLSGPTSKARPAAFKRGDEILAIRLRSGVHLPFISGSELTDVEQFLDSAGGRRFWLQNNAVEFPSFNNVEAFVEKLARLDLLRRDILIEDVFAKRSRNVSLRTIQRHSIATSGLTINKLLQIKRAEQARGLLTNGITLTSISYETGYSNPGHMTNAFKHFFGQTPKTMRTIMSNQST